MWLINIRTFALEEFSASSIPLYAILSHTWETDEVTFRDMGDLANARRKRGFLKIQYACTQARADYLQYVWVDTCCIDKSSSAELQEAINSMFEWYAKAEKCYVFLADLLGSCPKLVDDGVAHPSGQGWIMVQPQDEMQFWHRAFMECKWFTRGWTLQELIAPKELTFFGYDWNFVGNRSSLVKTISETTRIDQAILDHTRDVTSISVAQRMSWASHRRTSRIEDEAYSLLGIFGVNIPMLYGEGPRAFKRLQEEIMKTSSDHSLFAWENTGQDLSGSLLAHSPANFGGAQDVVQWGRPNSFEMTNRGLRITLPFLKSDGQNDHVNLAVLNCRHRGDFSSSLALRIRSYQRRQEYYVWGSEVRSATASRLVLVKAKDVTKAETTRLEITRKFEPESLGIKFWLRLPEDERTGTKLSEAYTTHGSWHIKSGILEVADETWFRASVLLECKSGRAFCLGLGFDRVDEKDRNGKILRKHFLPGVWARLKSSGDRARDICDDLVFDRCSHENEPDPLQYGCPRMSRTATAGTFGESEMLTADISQREIMEESIFVVAISIVPMYGLDPLRIHHARPNSGNGAEAEPVTDKDLFTSENQGKSVAQPSNSRFRQHFGLLESRDNIGTIYRR